MTLEQQVADILYNDNQYKNNSGTLPSQLPGGTKQYLINTYGPVTSYSNNMGLWLAMQKNPGKDVVELRELIKNNIAEALVSPVALIRTIAEHLKDEL